MNHADTHVFEDASIIGTCGAQWSTMKYHSKEILLSKVEMIHSKA